MSVKKLVVLLLAPLALVALVPLFLSGASDEAANQLGSAIGGVYGMYAGALLIFFVITKLRQRAG